MNDNSLAETDKVYAELTQLLEDMQQNWHRMRSLMEEVPEAREVESILDLIDETLSLLQCQRQHGSSDRLCQAKYEGPLSLS